MELKAYIHLRPGTCQIWKKVKGFSPLSYLKGYVVTYNFKRKAFFPPKIIKGADFTSAGMKKIHMCSI